MRETIPDLWPADISVEVQSPAAILRRQAAQLRIRTKDLLEAQVKTDSASDGDITYEFQIVAPALDGYVYTLFTASHASEFIYPISISFPWIEHVGRDYPQSEGRPSTIHYRPHAMVIGRREAATPSELLQLLKELLNSAHTKGIIMSLISRINETTPTDDPGDPPLSGQPE